MNEKLSLDELNRLNVETFKTSKKNQCCFILDDIRSRNNVGTFFRTADAFRAEKIYLGGITPTPPHRDIEKTAIGATESVDYEYVENLLIFIDSLRESGWIIISIEQTNGSVFLQDFEFLTDEKYAFIFGNEVFGVNQDIIDTSDYCVEIPQFGTKHSFNVAVSAGIVAWDYMSKTSLRPHKLL